MEYTYEVTNLYINLCKYKFGQKYPADLKLSIAHLIDLELQKKCKSSVAYQYEMYDIKINLDSQSIGNKSNILLKRIYQLMTIIILREIIPPRIYNRILNCNGICSIATLVRTPTYEFNEENQQYIEYVKSRNKSTIKYKTTKLYECHKCKARETIVMEKQIRCLDEAATAFINCVRCGHHWKQ